MSGFNLEQNISFIFVFLEGILSFFSPCILPLIPVYMAYLAGIKPNDDNPTISKKKIFLHTVFFCLGISMAFFLLGISFSVIGKFLIFHRNLLTRLGGILIVVLGLFQMGIIKFNFLQKERRLNFNLDNKEINPLIALIMGFTFSFAWTPCVGPALSSVLILASSAKSVAISNLLILVYTLGFIIPFLVLGVFTTSALNFFRKNKKILKDSFKISGAILIIVGFMTFVGNGVSGYTNILDKPHNKRVTEKNQNLEKEREEDFGFVLYDQYGAEHKLSDYKGKVVFLNFWATWCRPCNIEMPHIEEIYNEYGLNEEEVVILGVAAPKSKVNPSNVDIPKDDVIKFLDKNNYTFPTVFDETGEILRKFNINAFPTTFMIDKNGEIYGYVPGMISKEIMKSMIEETLNENK